MMKRIVSALGRLHRSEQGAEGLEKLLIVGAIVLPLLGILIWFKDDITSWLTDLWGQVRGDTTDYRYTGP